MIASTPNTDARPHSPLKVRVRRQDGPGEKPYWQLFSVPHEADMNVISVLQRIAAIAKTVDGQAVAPVAWDCGCLEEVCGSCTMVINGQVQQSCTALVDRLLAQKPDEIVLEPMSKFPVIRDLLVDRSRLFHALKRVKGWVPVDSYQNMGPGERQPMKQQEQNYPLSQCMSCGCCLEACPQYLKIELEREPEESDEAFAARQRAAYEKGFIGAHAISQVMLFNNHPTGKAIADERLDALTSSGGVQVCGNAQNCVAVCPKEIPLTRSIGRAGRAATIYTLKKFFDR